MSTNSDTHNQMANAIRFLSVDAIEQSQSGHPGMPMGMADVATVLFTQFLNYDTAAPDWADRDRFILSAGHGSMLIYSLLYLTGYPDMTLDEIKNFRQFGAKTAGHPEFGHASGIEMTTGPLGQGIATSVGMALAERMHNQRFGDDLVDHYTYVIAGDGCLMEGISQEAIDLAGHLKLSKLIVLWDDNGISIDGSTDLSTSTDQLARFAASGWSVVSIDGHNAGEIAAVLLTAKMSDKPSLIACKTTIGFGAPNKQGTSATHGAPLGAEETQATREALDWPHAAFEIPAEILQHWRSAATERSAAHAPWQQRLSTTDQTTQAAFQSSLAGDLDAQLAPVIEQLKTGFSNDQPKLATRQSSQKVLDALIQASPELISGSADLSGSNGTKTSTYRPVNASDFGGNYIHYGIREHGMAAAMNGIALHRGFIPFSGTFLAFADYSRGAIRLGALMGQRVIHVMSHDSIGLGEDGPTHQPIEHLASLRAMPNLLVYRPGDAVETAEAWQSALSQKNTPSIMCLSRQGMRNLRNEHQSENQVAKGAYVLQDCEGQRQITLIATGSELAMAVDAANLLSEKGFKAAVVSMPCWELFEQQPAAYQQKVLGDAPRIGVEAATRFGWDRWLGHQGQFIGMQGFGGSAPAEALYENFGITTANVVETAISQLV
ncbi:MAG: Transketolase (EC [uncultured Thiotrichaceae bacterium]|uniref:Transketolase n=1 Tax=uncultured Thiotrichaceae bacterium TaxID=298394 RepID=A0A6S6TN97_9GAMM|nr:MAG: Transketolase (EC [uncultured Thiotrichaceae bacterium]